MTSLDLVDAAAWHYLQAHPKEAALTLACAEPESLAKFLDGGDDSIAVRLLAQMPPDQASQVLVRMAVESARSVLLGTDFVLVARWLAQLSDDASERLMDLLPSGLSKSVREALEFPEGTAGDLMDTRVVALQGDLSVEQALRRLRQVRDRRITDLLVVDREGKLTATIPLQDLLSAEGEDRLSSLTDSPPVFVNPMTQREDVVELLTLRRLSSLPVLDLQGKLLGTLRYDALVQATQDQASAEMQQMFGAGKEERALSTPLAAIQSRLPWLLINLLTAFLAASVVGLFDETIAQFTALAVLLPVVAGQSGNTGAQALAVTSRGLALREIRISHWFRVLGKEVLAAFGNGMVVATVTSAGVYWWSRSLGLAGVIGLSMILSMLMAAVAGAVIPIILTALKRDPATASSIILTTVTDVAGFFSFLGLATLLSRFLVEN